MAAGGVGRAGCHERQRLSQGLVDIVKSYERSPHFVLLREPPSMATQVGF